MAEDKGRDLQGEWLRLSQEARAAIDRHLVKGDALEAALAAGSLSNEDAVDQLRAFSESLAEVDRAVVAERTAYLAVATPAGSA